MTPVHPVSVAAFLATRLIHPAQADPKEHAFSERLTTPVEFI